MARNVVDELVVRLTADATRLQAELGKAERDATNSGRKVGASFGEAFRNAARLGAIAVTSLTAVGTAFFVAANRAAEYADRIDKTAIRTRLSRGALQELAFAADQAGVEFTAIEANIRAFTGRLAEAERGSVTVTGTFDRLGVALRDQNGALRDTESLFLDTIEALSGIDNESTRAALAVQAFGEQGSALLPFLSVGAKGLDDLRAKARELGLVLDDQAIGSLVEYKDEVSALGQQFAAVQREAVTKLIPVLRDDVIPLVRDDLLPAFVSLVNFLAEDVAPVVGNIATGFTDLSTAFNTFVGAWESGEGRLEGTLGILERIRNLLGFNPSQGLEGVLGLSDTFFSNNGSGGRGLAGPRFDVPSGVIPFGPQPRPDGFVPPPGVTPPPPGGGGGGGAAGAVARTVADVFADLAGDGAARERFAAAFGLTPENIIASASARQALVESALRELLSDFAGVVTDAQIAFLVERYTALGEIIRQNTDAPIPLPDVTAIAGGNPVPISDRGARRGDGGLAGLIAALDEVGPLDRTVFNTRTYRETLAAEIETATAEAAAQAFDENPFLDATIFGTRAFREGQAAAQGRAGLLASIGAGSPSDRGRTRGDGGVAEAAALLAAQTLERAIQAFDENPGLDRNVNLFLATQANQRRAALLASIGAGAPSDRGATRGSGLMSGGDVFVPPTVPPEIQGLIDVGAKVRLELERGAQATELAAQETKRAIITAGVQFGSDLASAIKSGSPSGIFGALTGGIGGLVGIANPFAGGLINLIGGLFGGFLPDGRDESEAARAAGARPNGAPAVELNLQVFQNLAVQSLTGESRAAVDGLLDQTVGRIESVLVSFGQRLTAVEARTA